MVVLIIFLQTVINFRKQSIGGQGGMYNTVAMMWLQKGAGEQN